MHKAQIARDDALKLVRDEDAVDVEFDVTFALGVEKVDGGQDL